jgi:hypothetical protein
MQLLSGLHRPNETIILFLSMEIDYIFYVYCHPLQ